MQHTGVEVLLYRQIPDTGHKRLPQRSIIGPFGKGFIDVGVMESWFALRIVR
jgi:hypothetical protein